MRRFWAGVVLLAALGLSGSALAVIGGSADSGHPYAGAVFADHELCSGAFVSPTAFVTAAHCFADGSTVQITFGQVTHPGSVYTTDAPTYSGTVHDDPAFCLGCGNGIPGADTGDVAVVTIAAPGYTGPLASLPAIGLDDTLSSQQTVDVVGYGVSAITSQGAVLAFGTKQVATVQILGSTVGSEFLKLQANPGACLGDSGGPNLISGTDTIAAINSFSNGGSSCNGNSYSERLDTQAAQAFIASWS